MLRKCLRNINFKYQPEHNNVWPDRSKIPISSPEIGSSTVIRQPPMGQDTIKKISVEQKENHGCSLNESDSHGICYILSIKAKTTACCSSLSLDQRSKSFCWDSVRETEESPSANSWDKVMPNAVHIFSRDGIVGTMFLRYQEDMVDWGKPERSASWYSVQPLSSRYVVMDFRISFTALIPLLVIFVNYTSMNRCNLIIYIV